MGELLRNPSPFRAALRAVQQSLLPRLPPGPLPEMREPHEVSKKHFFFEKKKQKTFIPWPFASLHQCRADCGKRGAME